MKLYSTNNRDNIVDFTEAVLNSMPVDKGLYMPMEIPALSESFLSQIEQYSFQDIAYEIAKTVLQGYIPEEDLRTIIDDAINFDAPVVHLHDNIYTLELFHGPTLAFKDFGARFMSRIMNYLRDKDKKLYILVATSGDTGGAVASGFYDVEGIEVIILFPKGKVSPLQQKQLTTLGKNITALEIDGTFDDCQAIVKQAFLDLDLIEQFSMSSANSINIARLIPQSFYYMNAVAQLKGQRPTFVVPSGNFGNITAGILGHKMGMPVEHFVAATNINDVVPEYIYTGKYKPRTSEATISNAMDVGNPSNFYRMVGLFGSTWNNVKEKMKGYAYTDEQTRVSIAEVYKKYNYTLDPHGAIGYLAAIQYQKESNYDGPIVFLETAHPSKFISTVEETIDTSIDIPERLNVLKERKEDFTSLSKDFGTFKTWYLENK